VLPSGSFWRNKPFEILDELLAILDEHFAFLFSILGKYFAILNSFLDNISSSHAFGNCDELLTSFFSNLVPWDLFYDISYLGNILGIPSFGIYAASVVGPVRIHACL
jgi:hypothetical protein